MSDDEERSSIEDDFSASEDEWKPEKSRRQASDESDDDDSDFEDDTPNSRKRETKANLSSAVKSDSTGKKTKKRKSTGTSLRTKLFNKYKPPPKTLRNQSTPSKQTAQSTSEQKRDTAQTSKKAAKKADDASDSDSSGSDYLVNPSELNLQSSFFDVKPANANDSSTAPPVFDCNAGMCLTDSEGDNDEDDETESMRIVANATGSNAAKAKAAAKHVDLGYLQNFSASMEKAKIQYKKHKDDSMTMGEDKVDVSSLLAMGEGTSHSTAPSTKSKSVKRLTKKMQPSQGAPDTDSDWEEVEGVETAALSSLTSEALANGIQVSVDLPQRHRKDKKTVDVEATLKRQLNRAIKENQIFLHKVSLIGHIYHGLYLNKIARNTELMPIALKIIPSNNVYPSGQTEVKYFQSMVTWFKTAIKIHDDRMYPKLKVNPIISLAVQMKHRHAVCKRDFILMFIILLRAMGMQCRLVVNLTPMALRPPQSSLCSLKTKPDTDKKDEKSSKKKSDKKEPPPRECPLTKEEREELRQQMEALENDIKKKKAEKMKPRLSFEEDLEVKSPSPTISIKSIKAKSIKKTLKNDTERKRKSTSTHESDGPEKKKKVKEVLKESPYFADTENVAATKKKQAELIASIGADTSKESPSISVDSKLPEKSVKTTRSKAKTATSKKTKEVIISDFVVKAEPNKTVKNVTNQQTRVTRSRSKSPNVFISTDFLHTKSGNAPLQTVEKPKVNRKASPKPTSSSKAHISPDFLKVKSTRKPPGVEAKPDKPSPRKLRSGSRLTIPQMDGANDLPKTSRKHSKQTNKPNSDEDFEPTEQKKPRVIENLKKLDRRVLTPDITNQEQSPDKNKKKYINMWVEVYCELEEQWVCVDLFKGKVNCLDSIRKTVSPTSLAYVFAFNNDATLKDVTPRYCQQWATMVRKGRVDQTWLDEAIADYISPRKTKKDIKEDADLRRIHLDKPLPTTISEYKDHPLYALRRHLLKFQAIYPENALTLGYVRGEPVFARECVHTLHSRDMWYKSARVVKPGEEAYKIVKARPKWDKFNNTVIKDQPLEIFGYWQTTKYEPPTAKNGVVPRNAYGNVDLFKECMLPKKTIHLCLPGLNKVCKKLGIDCAPAVIGFDFHQGACHPLHDGFVVCEEFADKVVDAWNKEQEDAERKEQEKYEARVYGNWKKLIKGLLIRERLKLKYKF